MNSLAKPHAFVTDEFARLDCVQCIHSNINAAPKLIIKNVLGGFVQDEVVRRHTDANQTK